MDRYHETNPPTELKSAVRGREGSRKKKAVAGGKKRPASWCAVDEIIEDLEAHGLGWSLDHTANLIECRIWDWPEVVGRYRPDKVEPLVQMLQRACDEVPKHYWGRKKGEAVAEP